jgi:hypothetical protein
VIEFLFTISRTWISIIISVFSLFSILYADQSENVSDDDNNFSLKYSLGQTYLLPSLHSNSYLNYSSSTNYSDIALKVNYSINANLRYSGMVELTDKPHNMIGTKYSRSDYPLSTGRVQKSIIEYRKNNLKLIVGRDNFFEEVYRPGNMPYPINGDGFSWSYQSGLFLFKYVIESLPAENLNNIIYRRLLTYHHLEYRARNIKLGVGEYFILTGNSIGLDLKRLNPFLPFALNSHDSESDYFPGFEGDSDNSLIVLFLNWESINNRFDLRLYIDEFQLDSWDRKLYNDAILFSINGKRTYKRILNSSSSGAVEASISLSNPNFGHHNGPFTSATSAGYSFFESTPGMTSNIYLKSIVNFSGNSTIKVSGHHHRWVEIATIPLAERADLAALIPLPIMIDNRILFEYDYNISPLNFIIVASAWQASTAGNNGMSLSFEKLFAF